MGAGRVAYRGECAGSITSDCAPMAASISTSEQPSRQVTATGSRCLPVAGGGVPRAGEPITDLFENVCLTTAAADYAWVNARQIWGVGTASLVTGKIHVEGYLQ